MSNINWNNEFPEVPEHVHQTVLSTLAELDSRKGKRMKRMKKSKIIILAAAIVAVLGVTVSATELFKWNKRTTEVFMANGEQQQKLETDQIAQEPYQTVSNADLTIQAIQTIQDNNCFYALFERTAADETLQITPDHSMEYLIDYQGAENPFGGFSSGFVQEQNQAISNNRYYELFGTKMNAESEDLNIKI